MEAALRVYADELERHLASGIAREQTYRPALATLIQALREGAVASNDPAHIEAGAPDYTVWINSAHGPLTIGYVEAKDVGATLDAVEESEQLRRYLSLPNLVLTDYLEFRWYRDGARQDITARLGQQDGRRLIVDEAGAERVAEVLRAFLGQDPLPVRRAEDLARRMATLAHLIRDAIVRVFALDRASVTLRDLRTAFAEVLIPEIKVEEFADMFAQTLAYGLFAGRVNHDEARGHFTRADAGSEIPRTNPFLRRLFGMIAGPELDAEPFVGFVDDLARLLARADMSAVLADFGRHAGRNDPVVHFYETFLQAYDPTLRELRGVYYTPEAVVSYIVRSVDRLLRDRFACPAGLADTEMRAYRTLDEAGQPQEATSPRVLILDPACGTGTFLYSVVEQIRSAFREQNNAGLWRGYVRDHLLPRLFGFELLMAPYAVAHLKLGMQLAALDLEPAERATWAYDFGTDDRLDVFLTNSLEPSVRAAEIPFGAFISQEANAAAAVKRDLPIMVVLGNPPYSGHSANASSRVLIDPNDPRHRTRERTWIGSLINDYFFVDDAPLAERNPKWLHDDYVKFIRFGQWRIDQTGAGVLAFITNHAYLTNRNFRGMRQQLMQSFSDIYILDLHGNARSRHHPPGGGVDQNVFDIQQGVAIALFLKDPAHQGPARVFHADLWGSRTAKYGWLDAHDYATTEWEQVEPRSRFYLFKPQNLELVEEYERGWRLTDALPVNVNGFQTHRDHFAVAFDRDVMVERMDDLRDPGKNDDQLRETYNLTDNRDWHLADARAEVQGDASWEDNLIECLYRPFDTRWCYFSPVAMDYPRRELQRHVAGRDNVCLGAGPTGNAVDDPEWSLVFSSRAPTDSNVFRRGGITLFPIYLYGGGAGEQVSLLDQGRGDDEPTPNFAEGFINAFAVANRLRWVDRGSGNLQETFGPEDVFHYIYALLHSQNYRLRYADFLDTDYPRIHVPTDPDLFASLAAKGSQLFELHQLEAESLTPEIANYPIPGSDTVEIAPHLTLDEEAGEEAEPDPGAAARLGRIYINEARQGREAQYFDGVPEDVWEFRVGGFQVCEKWLTDRRRRAITSEVRTFLRIVTAIRQTIDMMEAIDDELEDWPWAVAAPLANA